MMVMMMEKEKEEEREEEGEGEEDDDDDADDDGVGEVVGQVVQGKAVELRSSEVSSGSGHGRDDGGGGDDADDAGEGDRGKVIRLHHCSHLHFLLYMYTHRSNCMHSSMYMHMCVHN